MSSTSNAVLTADSIWLDGKIVPWAQGQVPIMTHALVVLFVVDADARPVCGPGSGQEDPGTAWVGPVDPSAAPLASGSGRL